MKSSLEEEAAGILAEMARLERAAATPIRTEKRSKNLTSSPQNFCSLSCFCSARVASGETLNGTVKNGTTGKPAAGDDVVLIKLAQGWKKPRAPRPTPTATSVSPCPTPVRI